MVRQSNFPRGGRPPGGFGALAGLALLGGGAFLIQNSLFNVDGGHRAIKYRRVSGVSKEIYSEGTLELLLSFLFLFLFLFQFAQCG